MVGRRLVIDVAAGAVVLLAGVCIPLFGADRWSDTLGFRDRARSV
jgi:hypothetical protein